MAKRFKSDRMGCGWAEMRHALKKNSHSEYVDNMGVGYWSVMILKAYCSEAGCAGILIMYVGKNTCLSAIHCLLECLQSCSEDERL